MYGFKKKQFLFLSDSDVIANTHSTISYTVCLNKIIHPVDLVMHNIITLHTQLEQGKVIGTCVCMYNIYVYQKTLNGILAVNLPFQIALVCSRNAFV